MEAHKEKLDRYFKRTTEHIHRVQNNMLMIVTKYRDELALSDNDCRELMFNVMKHDRTKFSTEQFHGYVEMTEFYHQRRNVNKEYQYPSKEIEALTEAAWVHHYMNENHHPEKHGNGIGKWSKFEAIECACDLQAMAQEFNEGTCRKYYEEVWKKKQSKHFYDDFNWHEVIFMMNAVVRCFEIDLMKAK